MLLRSFAIDSDQKRRTKAALKDLLTSIVQGTTDQGVPLLLQVVADGPYQFRLHVLREAAADRLAIDEHVCTLLFQKLAEIVVRQYGRQPAAQILDQLHVPSPETPREFQARVDNSWEYECGSSEAARRTFHQSDEANRLFGRRS